MKISCLINSHNYVDFIGEAVRSALDQTQPFEEIVVVDDGSSDGTVELLAREFGHEPRVKVVAKPQAGQLSCFNRGIEHVHGDIVCFLDADDRFTSEYAATIDGLYESEPEVDFLSVNLQVIGHGTRRKRRHSTRDRGMSVISTILRRTWVGMPTSCLSMKTACARKLLPFPSEAEWQTRADDVLIFGASLVGAHKFHLNEPLVEYRIHGNNHFAGRKLSRTSKLRHWLRVNQLIAYYVEREGYDVDMLPRLLHREFRTWERPTTKEMFRYLGMSMHARLPLGRRCEQIGAIIGHKISETLRPRTPVTGTQLREQEAARPVSARAA